MRSREETEFFAGPSVPKWMSDDGGEPCEMIRDGKLKDQDLNQSSQETMKTVIGPDIFGGVPAYKVVASVARTVCQDDR